MRRIVWAVLCIAMVTSATFAQSYPTAPKNVSSWQTGRYTQIKWDPNVAESIVGYNVYRLNDPSGAWRKLNLEPIPIATFVDEAFPTQHAVYYQVTAVSTVGTESPFSITTDIVLEPYKGAGDSTRSANTAFGTDYDKNNIISDQQLLASSAMSAAQIQAFLNARQSVLASYSANGRTAAQIIYDACHSNGISPHVVLVTLQKEQGLIGSSTSNLQARLDWAMGWGERSTFVDQINNGTRQFKRYYENLGGYVAVGGVRWAVGQPRAVSDGTVTAGSTASAGLYIYTPWIGQRGGGRNGIGGNYLFWDTWHNVFGFTVNTASPEITSITGIPQHASWVYYQSNCGNPLVCQWYISNTSGETYLLSGANGYGGEFVWGKIANGNPVATVNYSQRAVSVASSASTLTSTTSYPGVTVAGGRNLTVFSPRGYLAAQQVAGKTLPHAWYFFRVESTQVWYIVNVDGTETVVYRLRLNADNSDYDWLKMSNSSWKRSLSATASSVTITLSER